MKHIPLLIVVLTLTCAAQQPFDWPFQEGVYYYRLAGNHAWLAGQFMVER